jgi:hypothetical protein
MKKVTMEIVQAVIIASIFATPFVFYFASMKP